MPQTCVTRNRLMKCSTHHAATVNLTRKWLQSECTDNSQQISVPFFVTLLSCREAAENYFQIFLSSAAKHLKDYICKLFKKGKKNNKTKQNYAVHLLTLALRCLFTCCAHVHKRSVLPKRDGNKSKNLE